jgi:hypothetical protein
VQRESYVTQLERCLLRQAEALERVPPAAAAQGYPGRRNGRDRAAAPRSPAGYVQPRPVIGLAVDAEAAAGTDAATDAEAGGTTTTTRLPTAAAARTAVAAVCRATMQQQQEQQLLLMMQQGGSSPQRRGGRQQQQEQLRQRQRQQQQQQQHASTPLTDDATDASATKPTPALPRSATALDTHTAGGAIAAQHRRRQERLRQLLQAKQRRVPAALLQAPGTVCSKGRRSFTGGGAGGSSVDVGMATTTDAAEGLPVQRSGAGQQRWQSQEVAVRTQLERWGLRRGGAGARISSGSECESSPPPALAERSGGSIGDSNSGGTAAQVLLARITAMQDSLQQLEGQLLEKC